MVRSIGKLCSELLLTSVVRNVICYVSVSVPLLLCFFSTNLTSHLFSHPVVDFPQGNAQLSVKRLFESFVILFPPNNITVFSNFLDKRSVVLQRW